MNAPVTATPNTLTATHYWLAQPGRPDSLACDGWPALVPALRQYRPERPGGARLYWSGPADRARHRAHHLDLQHTWYVLHRVVHEARLQAWQLLPQPFYQAMTEDHLPLLFAQRGCVPPSWATLQAQDAAAEARDWLNTVLDQLARSATRWTPPAQREQAYTDEHRALLRDLTRHVNNTVCIPTP